jgi:hypothetical protein
MTKQSQKFAIIFTIAVLCFAKSHGQKIKMLSHVFYGTTSYKYNENDYLRKIIKASSIPTYGVQTSIQLTLSERFRIGSGLQYVITKGKTDAVFVDGVLINSNTTGNFTLEANSSFLQVPIEMILTLNQKWKLKPFLAAGLNFYIPLKQYYFAQIIPLNPTTFYRRVENTIGKGTEYRGSFIGSGMVIPLNEKRELELRLSYRFNSFRYQSPVLTVAESRSLKSNILEISLGIRIF